MTERDREREREDAYTQKRKLYIIIIIIRNVKKRFVFRNFLLPFNLSPEHNNKKEKRESGSKCLIAYH